MELQSDFEKFNVPGWKSAAIFVMFIALVLAILVVLITLASEVVAVV